MGPHRLSPPSLVNGSHCHLNPLSAVAQANGPALHVIEPSGNSFRFFGAAVGKGRQLARNEIEKLKLGELTCRCRGYVE